MDGRIKMEEVPNQVIVNKRGRKKKIPDELILTEYKNVTEKELIWMEIYGEDDKLHPVSLLPQKTIFLSERDIRKYRDDQRFLEGRVVPVGSEQEIILTKNASDIMTDEQIHYFIKNVLSAEELNSYLDKVNSISTITRMIKEAKEQDKSYSFVSLLDKKMEELLAKKKEMEGK
jgi:ethanolamine utilization cobalamin adenosyltransferase